MFIDQVRINVKGGDGGSGCMSFRREAHVPKGGPDGGDGGHGGNIIVVTDPQESSLIEYRFKHHFKATKGTHGKGSKLHGANGDDMILGVPAGTIVYELDPDTMERMYKIADLVHPGERVVVADGGRGGKGNTHFVTSTRRAPSFAELGEPSKDHWIELELKVMADAALVGMPSVGKSSLIASMSAARPKIADYPFTTLVPNLGMVSVGEYNYVVADIPGLIEGAAEGKGLGHDFLRHIERSAIILHVVDLTGSYEGRDPVEDYRIIKDELRRYAAELAERPCIVIGNKCDVPGIEINSERMREVAEADGYKYFEVSAATRVGMSDFMLAVGGLVRDIRAETEVEDTTGYDQVWENKRLRRKRQYVVTKEKPGIFRVTGESLERMIIQTDFENEEALIYLQHRFNRLGLEGELMKHGAKNNDTVKILGFEFEFQGADDFHPEGLGDALDEDAEASDVAELNENDTN